MKLQKNILLTDSISGITAGIFTLSLSSFLSNLYDWKIEQIQFFGVVNILYGSYSGFIYFRLISKNLILKQKIIILILANSIWAGHCFTQIWYMYSVSSIFGILHLGLEGIYVLVLAYLETKFLFEIRKYGEIYL